MACPVCKSNDVTLSVHKFEYGYKTYNLSGCNECGCWFYNPFPTPDYVDGLTSEISLRHYLETCAGIEGLASISENFYTNYVPGSKKGLEIGCGFGFVSHYLEKMQGQQMTAYEPSDYGVKGKKILGLNIIHDFYKSDGTQQYDFCISTEVIEHIEDPVSFAANIEKGLTDNGVLLLSTPDKDAINMQQWEPVDIALLSPGMHTILFSEYSLKKMLLLAGFNHVIIKKHGSSLYAIASRSPLKDKELFATDFNKILQYYKNLYNTSERGSALQKGIFYRLFRLYVDFGFYEDAAALLKNNPDFYIIAEDAILSIQTESDLTKFYTLTDSIIYFYCGILYLNHLRNYEKAANLFYLSFIACKKRLHIVPHFSIVDADIIWQAKLHEGIAYQQMGKPIEAAKNFIEILSYQTLVDNIPSVRAGMKDDAKRRLKMMVESL